MQVTGYVKTLGPDTYMRTLFNSSVILGNASVPDSSTYHSVPRADANDTDICDYNRWDLCRCVNTRKRWSWYWLEDS